jgi:tetratricopeptide (TPR) repeat protein
MTKNIPTFRLIKILLFIIASTNLGLAQRLDTLIDVGGYKLHFNIIKGKGTPILFEAGSNAWSSDWDTILPSIYKITGTTLITYDRSGFGKSELNLKDTTSLNHGIENGIKELEIALNKLGYNNDIISVCHSYGGFYSTLFTARHPNQVKYVIRLDANLVAAYTDDNLKKYHSQKVDRRNGLGKYYETINFQNTVRLMRKTEFPATVPVIDIIAGIPYHTKTKEQIIEFEKAHIDFVNGSPNRQLIKAIESAHDIKYDNPNLVINAIIKAYITTLDEKQKSDLLNKSLDISIESANQAKKSAKDYHKSIDNLNDLGYVFMENGEMKKALEVFKLNVYLFPDSWNVYDSYGEALLNSNNKTEAIKMYKKSLELNPDNENAKIVLDKLNKK